MKTLQYLLLSNFMFLFFSPSINEAQQTIELQPEIALVAYEAAPATDLKCIVAVDKRTTTELAFYNRCRDSLGTAVSFNKPNDFINLTTKMQKVGQIRIIGKEAIALIDSTLISDKHAFNVISNFGDYFQNQVATLNISNKNSTGLAQLISKFVGYFGKFLTRAEKVTPIVRPSTPQAIATEILQSGPVNRQFNVVFRSANLENQSVVEIILENLPAGTQAGEIIVKRAYVTASELAEALKKFF